MIVDATHPFAARISANAAAAAQSHGCPLWRLERPSWAEPPRRVDLDLGGGHRIGAARPPTLRRPFLTTGRQTLAEFLPWRDRVVLVRLVDPPDAGVATALGVDHLRAVRTIRASEKLIMLDHRIDVLITKDSGGSATVGKLEAAEELGIPVVIVRRPVPPADVPTVPDVAALLEVIG